MHLLFLFLDGVGLGVDDPAVNPLVKAAMPHLRTLLGGRSLTRSAAPFDGGRATLLPLDATLGVGGQPQSATGQAALLTGLNVPAAIGYHYGPKPNPEVSAFLTNGNLFSRLRRAGRRAALLNAYPPAYFEAVGRGRRLYSAIPLAVVSAGITLKTAADLYAGQALSADFTAHGWRERLGFGDAPVLLPEQAGERLAHLAQEYDFSFLEYWLSDYAGHGQEMDTACALLETFDGVLKGLLDAWPDEQGLVLLTSDHGNLEDLSTRHHTLNAVPGLLIGAPHLRRRFVQAMPPGENITCLAAAIEQLLRE